MAATMLGSLLVSLGLDSGQFKSGLTDAEKRMARAGKNFETQGKKIEALGKSIGNGIRTLGALAVGGSLVAIVKQSFDLASSLGEVAQQLGVTTNALQEFRYVGSQVGLTQAEMDQSLSQLTRRIGEAAQGTKAQAEAFYKLGIAVKDSNGNVINAADAIPRIADALQKVKSPAEQAAIVVDLFGKAGMKMLPALLQGSQGINALRDAAHKLGIVLSSEQIAKADETADKLTALKQVLEAKIASTVIANSSAILGLANALSVLVDNIGEIAKVGAVIATVFGVRWVASFAAATARTIALRVAGLGMIATMGGMAAAARVLGASLLAAFGGPVGVAILAVGAALYYTTTRTKEADAAARAAANAELTLGEAARVAADYTNRLAAATGKAREQLIATMKASIASATASLQNAKAKLTEARAMIAVARANGQRGAAGLKESFAGSLMGQTLGYKPSAVATAEASLAEAEKKYALADGLLQGQIQALAGAVAPGVATPPAASGSGSKPDRAKKGRDGPDAKEIEARFNAELASYAQQAISSMASVALSTEEKADLETRSVELARIRTLDEIKLNKDYNATQKARLVKQVEGLAELERARIEFEKTRQLEAESQQLSEEQFRGQQDALRLQFDMADTQIERKRLALELLALEDRYQRSMLEAVLASETASKAEKQRAQMALDFLAANASARQQQTSRQNETQIERYLRGINQTPAQINESIDAVKIDGLEALNQGLVDALMGVKSLGEAFRQVASQIIADLLRIAVQKAIVAPLANALFGGNGGGSSGFLSTALSFASAFGGGAGGIKTGNIKSIPGFARGTPFAPGGLALVGERGPEIVNLPRGSRVFPNGTGPGSRSEVHSPSFYFPGITNAKEAREAAGQAARRYRSEMNGPLRRVS